MRLIHRWAMGLSAATLLLLIPAPALADPFPGNADTTYADSATHIYCLTRSFTTDPDVAHYAMQDMLEVTTGMTAFFQVAGCDPAINDDIWWWETNLPAGTRGLRTCIVYTSSSVCNSNDVEMDFAEIDPGPWVWEDRRKTAVHELGHTLGFGHYTSTDAMRSGAIPNTLIQYRRFCDHHEDHLDRYAPGGTDFFECTF